MHFYMDMLSTTLVIPRELGQYYVGLVAFASLFERGLTLNYAIFVRRLDPAKKRLTLHDDLE